AVAPVLGIYGGKANVSATLTAEGQPVADVAIAFDVDGDGTPDVNATTNRDGMATAGIELGGLNAGQYPGRITATFAGNTDYLRSTASGDLVVEPASPLLTWRDPAPIADGTPLGDAQLSATASVPGTFDYSAAAGTTLPPGSHTLTVTF